MKREFFLCEFGIAVYPETEPLVMLICTHPQVLQRYHSILENEVIKPKKPRFKPVCITRLPENPSKICQRCPNFALRLREDITL